MMNPNMIMKLMSLKNTFEKNHPKFVKFLKAVFGSNMLKEGTIIEINVHEPGTQGITSSIQIQQSDLELFQELKELMKNQS